MHVDRRFGIAVAVSLVWALIVTAFFYRLAAGSRRAEPLGRPVLIAARDLPLGAMVAPDCVKTVRFPAHMVPNGAFTRLEEVAERPVTSPILAGEPLIEARLAPRGSGLGLGPMIPPGMRALAVRVNDVVGVAGFVLPGMRVDVVATGRAAGDAESGAATVLQNVTVLSAGQTMQADAKSPTITAQVVTLLVTPAEAEVLALANTEGRIQLVLRNSTDRNAASTPGRRWNQIFGGAAPRVVRETAVRTGPPVRPGPPQPGRTSVPAGPVPPPVAPAPAPVRAPDEVVMIRGNVKTVESARPEKGR